MKWWENPSGATYKSISVIPDEGLSEERVDELLRNFNYYKERSRPVFFGHYWLEGIPKLHRNNICCLDYSAVTGGPLVAYSLDDELNLVDGNFTFV